MEIKLEDHVNLAHIIARKYSSVGYRLHIEHEDLYQTAMIGIWKATLSFNLDREVTFVTFASRVASNEIKMYIRSLSAKRAQIGNLTNDSENILSLIPDPKNEYVFSEIDTRLTVREVIKKNAFSAIESRIIAYLLTHEDIAQRSIAKAVGCARSHTHRVLKKLRINFIECVEGVDYR